MSIPGENTLTDRAQKGRGSISRRDGRFERLNTERVDDGWQAKGKDEPDPLRTTLNDERPRAIISRNKSPDIGFDRSINPYRGCEHGCVYCYARPTHAYLGLSPGLDFETRLFAKPNAAELLRRELAKPGHRCATIMLGANTDAYQPVERDRGITRAILEVLNECNHPVAIATKSHLVTRDVDILADMARRNLASVGVSVTTLDNRLANKMEPRAAAPRRRLAAIKTLSEAGVPVAVMAAPMIPALTDWELERILEAASDHGAIGASYILLRLPLELKGLFNEWLLTHRPNAARRVMNKLRESRDGNLYASEFGTRMRGTGRHADMLASRFRLACKRFNLAHGTPARKKLDTTAFVPPQPLDGQMRLL